MVAVLLAPQLCGRQVIQTTLPKAHPLANVEMPQRSTTSLEARCFGAPALSRLKAVISATQKIRTTSTPCGWLNNHSHESPCGSFLLFFLHFQKEPKRNQRNAGPILFFRFRKNQRNFFLFSTERNKESTSFCCQKEAKNSSLKRIKLMRATIRLPWYKAQ